MKLLFTLFLLLMPFVKGILPNDDKIKWTPETKLTWGDFHAQLGQSAWEVARVDAGIEYSYYQNNDSVIKVTIYAYCNRTKSAKTADVNKLNDYILKHEQGHFDLWELYTRMLEKKLLETIVTDRNEITNLYHQAFIDANTIEDKYDNETNHSINTAEQEKWNSYIAQQLKEYSAYTATDIQVRIRKKR